MKINDFEYFNDKEQGNNCLIVGGAPNIENIKFNNFAGKIISMGDIPIKIKDKCKVDYWVNSNSYFPQPDSHYEILNEFEDTTLIFAHSVINSKYTIDYSMIEKYLKLDWFEFDQRHFGGMKCSDQIDYRFDTNQELNCCKNISEITIQEYLQKKFNSTCHYSTASTVAIHAVAFAMIMGFENIYLVGVDIPLYQKNYLYPGESNLNGIFKNLFSKLFKEKHILEKYFYFKLYMNKFIPYLLKTNKKSEFYADIPMILKDFQYLNNLCIDNNISLYNLNDNSTLRKIPKLKYLNPSRLNL